MKKNIWIIGIDLDKTFLKDNNKNYPNYLFEINDLKYLKELFSRGNKIIFLTGRSWNTTKKFYDLFDFNFGISNYNGTLLMNKNDEKFKKIEKPFDLKNIKKILMDDLIKNKYYNVIFEYENFVKILNLNDEIVNQYKLNFNKIEKLDIDKNNDKPLAIYIRFNQEEVDKNYLIKELNKKYKYKFWTWNKIQNNIFNVEINKLDVNKFTSFEYFRKYHNVNKKNTIAFGDNYNDLELLKNVNHGVVMINGKNDLKKEINNITKNDNNNSGVVEYLKDFFKLNI